MGVGGEIEDLPEVDHRVTPPPLRGVARGAATHGELLVPDRGRDLDEALLAPLARGHVRIVPLRDGMSPADDGRCGRPAGAIDAATTRAGAARGLWRASDRARSGALERVRRRGAGRAHRG